MKITPNTIFEMKDALEKVSNYPELPPVPEGYDYWKIHGRHFVGSSKPYYFLSLDGKQWLKASNCGGMVDVALEPMTSI